MKTVCNDDDGERYGDHGKLMEVQQTDLVAVALTGHATLDTWRCKQAYKLCSGIISVTS